MKETVWLLRDPDRSGRYLLAHRLPATTAVGVPLGNVEVQVIPWRAARPLMEPESFYEVCRMSFADWCDSHPDLACPTE